MDVDDSFDDQQDYFDINSKWEGRHAAGDAYAPTYEQRSQQPLALSFDFAGRRVVVNEKQGRKLFLSSKGSGGF